MLFNSIEFLLFLPISIAVFYALRSHLKAQNLFLLAASYFFYGWWDYRFLGLIAFSSVVDFSIGIALSKNEEKLKRKILLGISLVVNLGLLGFLKYYNFFVQSFVEAFSSIGVQLNVSTLKIILPVGISFYTFQTLSYTIDVYKKKIPATKDWISFFAFVSFFPQLVAGPIERASNLLPQFSKPKKVSPEVISDGLRQILWGFFKKMVIADNCAAIVDTVFSNYENYDSPTLLLAAVLFSFQIYCDFSGYSDIAIGTAKLFGFKLMTNFRVPYFSRDIAEFWRRWHISLSTWFRDYLYIPLGGSRGSKWKQIRNVFAIFLVSGFWHGANWTFIFWGGLNALLFLPLLLLGSNRKNTDIVAQDSVLPSIRELYQMLLTFGLSTLAWVFFRSDSIQDAFSFLRGLFTKWQMAFPPFKVKMVELIPLIALMIIIEWYSRKEEHQLHIQHLKTWQRHAIYSTIILLIFFFGKYNSQTFIYFQF